MNSGRKRFLCSLNNKVEISCEISFIKFGNSIKKEKNIYHSVLSIQILAQVVYEVGSSLAS